MGFLGRNSNPCRFPDNLVYYYKQLPLWRMEYGGYERAGISFDIFCAKADGQYCGETVVIELH